MRYHVRNAQGDELLVPSLTVLHDLYVHGFLGDDDLVRSETSARWIRAGSLPALHGVRERRAEPRKMALIVLAGGVVGLVRALLGA